MDAVARLNDACSARSVSWALFYDHDKVLRDHRYEVRVYGDGPYRVIQRGASMYEAAAKAADEIAAVAA